MAEVGALSPSGGTKGIRGAKLQAMLSKKYLGVKGLYWALAIAALLLLAAVRMKGSAPDAPADTGDAKKYDAAGNPLPNGLYAEGPAPSGITGGGSGAGSGAGGTGGEGGTSSGGGTSVGTVTSPEPYSPPPIAIVDTPAEPLAEEMAPIEMIDPAPLPSSETYMNDAIAKYTARGYSESQVREALGAYFAGRDMNMSQTLIVQKALREMGAPPSGPAKVGRFATAPATIKAPTTKAAALTPHQQHIAHVASLLAKGTLNTTAAKAKYGNAAVHEAKTLYPAASQVVAKPVAPAPSAARSVKTASPIATGKTVSAPKVAAPTKSQVANAARDLASGRLNTTAAKAKYGAQVVHLAKTSNPQAAAVANKPKKK